MNAESQVEPSRGWVSIKDQYPEDGQLVAVIDVQGTMALATYSRWEDHNTWHVSVGLPCSAVKLWCAITPPFPAET
jgi:hypothetical protein